MTNRAESNRRFPQRWIVGGTSPRQVVLSGGSVMRALCRPLLVSASLVCASASAQDERRVRQEVLSQVWENRTSYPVDPRLDDIPEEERALIEPAPPAERPVRSPSPAEQGAEAAVKMAPVIVEERRVNPLRQQLREHDRAVAAEQAKTVPTTLDTILNHPRLSIFGGYNAQARAAMARHNLRIMEVERMLLIAIRAAETEAEKQELKRYLWELREMRR